VAVDALLVHLPKDVMVVARTAAQLDRKTAAATVILIARFI
jgi:hypothetical protein